MKKKIPLLFLILVIVLAAVTWFQWTNYQKFLVTPLGLNSDLTVKKGDSAYKLGKKWQAAGHIDNFYYYQLLLKMQPELRSIKAGEYQVSPTMTPTEVLATLVEGKVKSYQVSVIEGSNIYELFNSISTDSRLDKKINDLEQLKVEFGLANDEYLEGIFFAETYQFNKGDSDLDIYQRANQQLAKVLEEEWNNRAPDLPYEDPYEALIMASIIEKETAVAAERPIIAGVFVRRLQKGMLLQTDPTIIYGLLPGFDGDIRRKDIKNPHPWNTYVHKGLPPSPIAMVGREAINAALNPQDGKALYFVAKGDGTHQFSETLKEHNNAVRKYQLKR
ncbi:endolytic transglycosylase MltG [Kangiella sp. HZ709]|uniref:endolytic transglycosylase MltG n=1 Tax=Kangiella sp. HZ709 TaxID=2666328 RepID=UPI0012B0C7A8|nr:endolytic transglycosylase MltG [Kangiella sp. HZ709]MRX26900.1 endolytic transglycosylase MltG [Kangiella sp. HZ709]